jgi:RHS repeat-associated protein
MIIGKERQAITGLDYFGARYFSGAQGRFTSVDPAFESEILEYPQTWNRYSYVYNNPLRFTDPDGRCPNCIAAGVGALIGGAVEGGIDLGGQLLSKRLSDVSWGEVGAHAAGGAITGGLAGLTMGGSLLTEIGVGAVANVAGGIVTRGIEQTSVEEMGDEDPFSGDEIAQDLVTGAVGAGIGHVAADLVHLPNPGSRPRPGRNFKTRMARYNTRVSARQTAATRALGVSAAAGASGWVSAAGHGLWNALMWLTEPSQPSQPAQQAGNGTSSTFHPCGQGDTSPGCPR